MVEGQRARPCSRGTGHADEHSELESWHNTVWEWQERPEWRLLRLCARTHLEAGAAAQIRKLAAGELVWANLAAMAARHQVEALLGRHLRQVCPDATPRAILRRLDEVAERVRRRNGMLALELIRLQRLFAANGITVIPLKGAALAATIYGDLAARSFSDLDFLVQAQDCARTERLLCAHGYRRSPYERDLALPGRLLGAQYHRQYWRPDARVLVEVHWRVVPWTFAPALATTDLWARVRTQQVLGTPMAVPAAEDLLLLLCLHGSRHLWGQLSYVCDVAECLRAYPRICWQQALERARRQHVERILLLGVILAWQLLDAPVPADVLGAARRNAVVAWLAADARLRLFRPRRRRVAWLFDAREFAVRMAMQDRRRDLPAVCAQSLYTLLVHLRPSERDRAAVSLPARLAGLYYLVRPLRAAGSWLLGTTTRIVARRSGGPRAPEDEDGEAGNPGDALSGPKGAGFHE
jgi:hypothetical protein